VYQRLLPSPFLSSGFPVTEPITQLVAVTQPFTVTHRCTANSCTGTAEFCAELGLVRGVVHCYRDRLQRPIRLEQRVRAF
jgi:hypothetical protein